MTPERPEADGGDAVAAAVRRIAGAMAEEDGPAVVALLADPDAPEASRELAGRLCDAVAERRRSVVANLAGPDSGFDAYLGAEGHDGLEGVRAGRIRLGEAPVPVGGRRFLYLPAGPRAPGEDAAVGGEEGAHPLGDPRVVGAVEKLATRIREAGGVLLLYLRPDDLPDRSTAGLVDGCVRLAGAVGVAGMTTLGRLGAGEGGPDESVETFLGLPDEPEEGAGDEPDRVPGQAAAEAAEPAGRGPAGAGAGVAGPEPAGPGSAEAGVTEGPGERGPEHEGSEDQGDPEPEPAAEREEPSATPAGTKWTYADGEPAAEEGPAAAAEPPHGPGQPAAADDGDGSGWRRHRRSAGFPVGKLLLGAAVVAALAGGWWYLAQRAAVEPAGAGEPAPEAGAPPAGAAGPAGADGTEEDGVDGGAAPTDAGAETAGGGASVDAAALAAVEASPELPYSVLVASYVSWSAARERLDRWSAEEGAPVLLAAPTPIDGRVYWRVFAGAVADQEAGRALNREVVDRGWKGEATPWEVRPASLAFRLGVARAGAEARARVSRLRDRGVPAYALPAAAAGDTVWAVWAGAYESREAAAELGRSLRDAGIRAELVTRRGATGGP